MDNIVVSGRIGNGDRVSLLNCIRSSTNDYVTVISDDRATIEIVRHLCFKTGLRFVAYPLNEEAFLGLTERVAVVTDSNPFYMDFYKDYMRRTNTQFFWLLV